MVTECDDTATQLKVINHQPKNEQQITMQINLYGALFKPHLHPLFVKINNQKTAIEK